MDDRRGLIALLLTGLLVGAGTDANDNASPLTFGVGGTTVRSVPKPQTTASTALVAIGLLLVACGGPSGSSSANSPTTNQTAIDIRGLPSTMSAVACASNSECWAVGTYKAGSATRALIEQNSGNGWTVVSSPRVSATGSLAAVTCVGAQDCWAVGAYGTDTGGTEPLITNWSVGQ